MEKIKREVFRDGIQNFLIFKSLKNPMFRKTEDSDYLFTIMKIVLAKKNWEFNLIHSMLKFRII